MSIFDNLMQGSRAISRGFGFLLKHRTLWPWALIPFIIQILVLVGLLTLFFHHFDSIYSWMTSFLGSPPDASDGFWSSVLAWVLTAVHILLRVVVAIFGTLMLLLFSFVIGLIVAGPFNDILSEKTERLISGRAETPGLSLWKSVLRSIVVELQKAVFFLGIPLVLLVLHIFPLIGSVVYLILTGLFEMWAAGFSFVDYPLGRRDVSFSTRFFFARRHIGALTGFGIVFWIPGMMILCAPALIVGGTLLYVDLQQKES